MKAIHLLLFVFVLMFTTQAAVAQTKQAVPLTIADPFIELHT